MSKRAVSLALASLVFIAVSALHAADVPGGNDQQVEAARKAFRSVYPEVERGNWSVVADDRDLLESYVLWPDLRATWFKATVVNADHDQIETFLDQHGLLKPARELRYRYALHLQGLEIAKLDCIALQAEIEGGRENRVVSRGLDLWLVGRSQADECDPVFANLRDRNLLTAEQYADRYALAIDAQQFTLARYLSRPLQPEYRDQANAWLDAQNNPLDFIAAAGADSDLLRRQLVYAVERLAFRQPALANTEWLQLAKRFPFSTDQQNSVNRHVALWSARLRQPQAAELLASLSAGAANTETGRWLVRANLLRHDWPEVIRAIDALPADESGKDEWQYWSAVAQAELGDEAKSQAMLLALAQQRSYHGFLAADAVGEPYVMTIDEITGDSAIAAELAAMPELNRARELFFVGLEGRGRSEWDAAVTPMTNEQQKQAALLAHEWGWHSRAISTVAKAGDYDDLQIRYPLPWRQDFATNSKLAGIADSWAYGVARSESLFMRDIRSSAGAIGLMQLMPDTGRRTARELKLPYAGLATLTDTASNIRLGTHYLGKMYSRFDDNQVLATAAYNAGPLRVEQWLPESGSLDARIWIENIPFNETRGYVKRVLTDEAIFHWRLTGKLRRISSALPHIVAATSQARSTD
jgi:soluble lytic murein transglycosylase